MDAIASHARLRQAGCDFIARRHRLLIDGQWVDARSGKVFAVFAPLNGQQIAQSGWRREMGYEAIEMCTETKAVAALL